MRMLSMECAIVISTIVVYSTILNIYSRKRKFIKKNSAIIKVTKGDKKKE